MRCEPARERLKGAAIRDTRVAAPLRWKPQSVRVAPARSFIPLIVGSDSHEQHVQRRNVEEPEHRKGPGAAVDAGGGRPDGGKPRGAACNRHDGAQAHAWTGVAFAVLAVVHGIPSVKGKRTRMAARGGGGAPKKAPHAADSHDILPGLVPDKRPLPHRRTVRRPRRQHGLRLLDGRAPCGRLLSGGLHRAPYAPQLGPPAPVSGSRQPLAGAGGVPIGARPQPMPDLCAFIAILTERALCQLVKQIALRPKGDQ